MYTYLIGNEMTKGSLIYLFICNTLQNGQTCATWRCTLQEGLWATVSTAHHKTLSHHTLHFARAVLTDHVTVLGKAEGRGENWHGHVTAVTVAPEFRRIGLAEKLMRLLEGTSEKV